MYTELNISAFLHKSTQTPVLDVRSPAEYQQGHMPEAISYPLFQNDERKVIDSVVETFLGFETNIVLESFNNINLYHTS